MLMKKNYEYADGKATGLQTVGVFFNYFFLNNDLWKKFNLISRSCNFKKC